MEQSKLKKALSNHSFQEALVFLVLGAALLIYSLVNHYTGMKVEWKMSPYLFPVLISVFLLALAAALLIQSLNQIREQSGEQKEKGYFNALNFVLTLVLVIAYYFSMRLVPFVAATVVLMVLLLLLFGERRWWMVALVSVLTTAVIYLLFSVGLHVNLP